MRSSELPPLREETQREGETTKSKRELEKNICMFMLGIEFLQTYFSRFLAIVNLIVIFNSYS